MHDVVGKTTRTNAIECRMQATVLHHFAPKKKKQITHVDPIYLCQQNGTKLYLPTNVKKGTTKKKKRKKTQSKVKKILLQYDVRTAPNQTTPNGRKQACRCLWRPVLVRCGSVCSDWAHNTCEWQPNDGSARIINETIVRASLHRIGPNVSVCAHLFMDGAAAAAAA